MKLDETKIGMYGYLNSLPEWSIVDEIKATTDKLAVPENKLAYWEIRAHPNPLLFNPLVVQLVSSNMPNFRLMKDPNIEEVDGDEIDTYKSNITIYGILKDKRTAWMKYSPTLCIHNYETFECNSLGKYRVWYNISDDGKKPMAMYENQCAKHIKDGIERGFIVEQLDFMVDNE